MIFIYLLISLPHDSILYQVSRMPMGTLQVFEQNLFIHTWIGKCNSFTIIESQNQASTNMYNFHQSTFQNRYQAILNDIKLYGKFEPFPSIVHIPLFIPDKKWDSRTVPKLRISLAQFFRARRPITSDEVEVSTVLYVSVSKSLKS